jgi:hypothetical protein
MSRENPATKKFQQKMQKLMKMGLFVEAPAKENTVKKVKKNKEQKGRLYAEQMKRTGVKAKELKKMNKPVQKKQKNNQKKGGQGQGGAK